jgi:phosphohistidine phosphatase SixA
MVMQSYSRCVFRTGVAVSSALLLAGSATAVFAQDMSAEDLVAAMQEGGHVIYIRHATTETDYADQVDATMGDCSTQRTLSEEGWDEAKDIGAAFALYDIPVGDVISSQYCRAWQTADLAFGRYEKNADLNFEPAEEYTEEQMQTMRDNVTPHLSAVPPKGNTILVAHDDPFDAATGIYPEPMGVTFVIRPGGDGEFEVLGHIPPDGWKALGN